MLYEQLLSSKFKTTDTEAEVNDVHFTYEEEMLYVIWVVMS